MGDAGYSKVGGDNAANDVKFTDPTGKFNASLDQFKKAYTDPQGNFDPNAAMNAFLGQSQGLTNMVVGATGPLSQMLDAQAQRDAKLGGEAALASMPGAQNSGAGMAAFGQAYADPFARAAIGTQQAQLGMLQPLMSQALGGQYGLMNNAMGQAGGMAGKMGDMWAPTYEKNKSGWDYAMDAGGLAMKALPLFL